MVRGRFWFAASLMVFLAVAVLVVARQTASHVAAGRLAELQERRAVLETEKMELMRRIRIARSRASLVPVAEGLGLRLPSDSEIVGLDVVDAERR